MSKYQDFCDFCANLRQNQNKVLSQMSDADGQVALFARELKSVQTMLRVAKDKTKVLEEEYKLDPTSSTVAADIAQWKEREKYYTDNCEVLKAGLKKAHEDLASMQEKNKEFDVTPYAEAATIEKRKEIQGLYGQFTQAINDALKAKDAYLKSLSKMNEIRNAGRHAVESGQKAAAFAKKETLGFNITQTSHFGTPTKQFTITEKDITKA